MISQPSDKLVSLFPLYQPPNGLRDGVSPDCPLLNTPHQHLRPDCIVCLVSSLCFVSLILQNIFSNSWHSVLY